MISHGAVQRALRTKLLTLSVATTGATAISATATGYARAAGSFLTDGFRPGMEVTGTGFSASVNNDAKTLTAVTALTLVGPGCSVETSGTRTVTVGVPFHRAWENIAFNPITARPYIEEQYLPGPMEMITLGATAQLEILPTYVIRLFVPSGYGMDAVRAYADALLGLYAPGTELTVTGHHVHVRTVPAPFAGQLLPAAPGFAMLPVTVPLRVRTANSI